jgi:hypothetical protein
MGALISSIIIVAVLAISGVYVAWRAGRLDRLHTRVETARAALDAALVRRSSVTLEIASSGLLDPASSVLLADLAHDARSATTGRELAESDLTRALRNVFGDPEFHDLVEPGRGGEELVAELESTAQQVFIARKFYNDAVAVTIAARRRPLPRTFRLAGGAPVPEFFEIDDTLTPEGMGEQGTDMPHLAG